MELCWNFFGTFLELFGTFLELFWNFWNTSNDVDPIERISGLMQLISLSHLEPVVNSNILLPVKVGHCDLQLVISLAGQSVEVVKAKPALSLKIIWMIN